MCSPARLLAYRCAMSSWRRRVLVVEDEPLVGTLLSQALEHAGFTARAATSALEARALVASFDPDAALIDINLGPGPSGLEFGHLLHRTHPHVALVFLTKYFDPRATSGSTWTVPAGSAFLSKDRITDPAVLTACLESALREDGSPIRHDLASSSSLAALTETQMEILRLAALGLTNSAIARRRGTAERTVEQRLQATYEALGIPVSPDINPRVESIKRYIVEAGLPVDTVES